MMKSNLKVGENMIGRILGNRYEIVEKVGGGGMAIVYKAKCNLLNRFVAVKILRSEFTNDKDLIDNFKRESQAAASLSHPNIVNIYDVGQEDDIYYIVMEYVDGKTLKELINEKGVLSLNEIINFTKQIALALDHAHSNHIIHRDIKPHNILITKDNRAKVTDFGIALAATSSTITNAGSIIGSVHYFAPEQARGGYTDEKSDLYSLGIVMYEMATGRVPFEGDTPVTIALKHIQETPEIPSKINPSIPKGLESIILKLIQKEQSARYANVTSLLVDINKLKNNPNIDNIDNTLKMENSPTQIIPIVTASEVQELIRSKNEIKGEIKDDIYQKGKNKKSKRKLVVGGAVVAALIAALIFTFAFFQLSGMFKTEDVEVPNFVGKTIEDAQKEAKLAKVQLNIEKKYDPKVAKDEVINQTTAAGMKVRQGFIVKVIVSEGSRLVTVPDIVYKNSTEAEKILSAAGLVVGNNIEEEYHELPIGTIIRQNPRAELQAAEGSAVDFTISKGAEVVNVPMPNLIGKTLTEAKNIVEGLNLKVGSVTEDFSDVFIKGHVIDQNIAANTETSEGSVVNLVVSKGSSSPDQMEDLEENNGTNEEPENPSELSTRILSINVGSNTGKVDIEIYQTTGGINKRVYNKKHDINVEGNLIQVPVTGSGRQEYTVYINGKNSGTAVVDF